MSRPWYEVVADHGDDVTVRIGFTDAEFAALAEPMTFEERYSELIAEAVGRALVTLAGEMTAGYGAT